MIATAKNGRAIALRKLFPDDYDALLVYLHGLSAATRQRFGPHPFTHDAILSFYSNPALHTGYIATDPATHQIIAYAVIRMGYLEHDRERLCAAGIVPDHRSDCSFAPSVADAWQGCGIGNLLFRFIVPELIAAGKQRIILWGGVQASNERAVAYYQRNGFRTAGSFLHEGLNYDMVLDSVQQWRFDV
jgi:diamine N-acetyltransferase